MTPETCRCFALIVAAQARIEGMKATNIERQENGHALAYDESAFNLEAFSLEQLAIQVINQ